MYPFHFPTPPPPFCPLLNVVFTSTASPPDALLRRSSADVHACFDRVFVSRRQRLMVSVSDPPSAGATACTSCVRGTYSDSPGLFSPSASTYALSFVCRRLGAPSAPKSRTCLRNSFSCQPSSCHCYNRLARIARLGYGRDCGIKAFLYSWLAS